MEARHRRIQLVLLILAIVWAITFMQITYTINNTSKLTRHPQQPSKLTFPAQTHPKPTVEPATPTANLTVEPAIPTAKLVETSNLTLISQHLTPALENLTKSPVQNALSNDELSFNSSEVIVSNSMAMLIIACNREDYLKSTLQSLASVYDSRTGIQIFISLDQSRACKGASGSLKTLISSLKTNSFVTQVLEIPLKSGEEDRWRQIAEEPHRHEPATRSLARHFKRALDHMYLEKKFDAVIVAEDDMHFSPDFIRYFQETRPLMDLDPSIWCVSSWNDLGPQNMASDNLRLFRTDVFPGLGWMINRKIWTEELSSQWPEDHWDWWIRQDTIQKNRDCIVPEVSRTKNIGRMGSTVGNGEFFESYIGAIAFNDNHVGSFGNLQYLLSQNYEAMLQKLIQNANRAAYINGPKNSEVDTVVSNMHLGYDQLILFELEYFEQVIAFNLGILPQIRSSHKGVVILRPFNSKNLLILADVRIAPYLHSFEKISPPPDLKVIAGKESLDCVRTCSNEGLQCSEESFQWLNLCSALKSYFPCERGCLGGVSGADIPNYVSNGDKKEFHQLCLTTTDIPKCQASHWSASRLCPCTNRVK